MAQLESNVISIDEETASKHFMSLLQNESYVEKIQNMLTNEERRLPINMDHLRVIDDRLPNYVIRNPIKSVQTLETRLTDVVKDMGEYGKEYGKAYGKQTHSNYRVTFEGNFGRYHVTPRGLEASLANQLCRVQGIVTKASIVRPKLMQSVHYCETTDKGHVKNYSDQYEISELSNLNNTYPTTDMDGHALATEFGLCKYKGVQFLSIQEIPERAPTGQLPRSVDIVLEEDLVDKVKPGDRVEVVGIFKTIANKTSTNLGIFRTVLIANNVYTLMSEVAAPTLTGDDIGLIKDFANREDCLDVLSQSLAPSIFGHDKIKKALLLMLLGGVEKNLENGTHLRGDMNILMIGDPSTAKSQLLRTVLNIAPLAINTTGRGSSGVGLTAAVNFDKDTGERFLEAGAMVLADRGIVCIDEFDKMNDVDRVTIHEVMEQQTVTIAKAGIHASLNARCSVLAAANPIYGSYQKNQPPNKNIALPDSLLSRFDLIFIVLDQKLAEIDRLIAKRVIRNHSMTDNATEDRYDLDSAVIEPNPSNSEEELMFIRYGEQEILSRQFLKKYIYYAKKTQQPQLTEEASAFITNAWTDLRCKEEEGRNKAVSITARTLETMIRISSAIAKACLSDLVEVKHCQEALHLLRFAIFAEEQTHLPVVPATTTVAAPASPSTPTPTTRRTRRRGADPNEEISQHIEAQVTPAKSTRKMKHVWKIILDFAESKNLFQIPMHLVWEQSKDTFKGNYDQFLEVIREMDTQNKIMYNQQDETVTMTV